MPHLFKKSFVRPKSAPSSQSNKISSFKNFKTPILAKENINKILQIDETTANKANPTIYYSSPALTSFKKDHIIASNASNLGREKLNLPKTRELKKTLSNVSSVSVQLSFDASDKVVDDSDRSNISNRMNEPKIKDAYLQFVKKLSQSSNECKLTSSPKSQEKTVPVKSPDMFTTPEEAPLEKVNTSQPSLIGSSETEKYLSLKQNKKAQKKNKPPHQNDENENPPKRAKKNNNKTVLKEQNDTKDKSKRSQNNMECLDSTISLSQEVLNRADVKAAYVNFMKSSLENEECIIKPRKVIGKKNVITSSSEESLDKSLEKGKRKRAKPATKNKNIRKANTGQMDDNEELYKTLPVQERMALIQESRNVGLYVLCDICNKARYLPDVKDPLDLPDKWYCAMHPDDNLNKCSYPEEILEDEDYLIDNLYNAGSIVWAKMYGYPWWPAMVEDDVDTETYFWLDGSSNVPTWYHVTFFDSTGVSRAWMRPSCLKPFKMNMDNPTLQTPEKNRYKSRVSAAVEQAIEAIQMPLIDRLKKYSFIYRYTKPLNRTRGNTSTFAEKRVKEKRRNKVKKVKKNRLIGHQVNSYKEATRSPIATSALSLDNQLVNDKGYIGGLANASGDISLILNEVNWTDSLSFNLLH